MCSHKQLRLSMKVSNSVFYRRWNKYDLFKFESHEAIFKDLWNTLIAIVNVVSWIMFLH